jgi:integrase
MRSSEILTLRRGQIDLKRRIVCLPNTRTLRNERCPSAHWKRRKTMAATAC